MSAGAHRPHQYAEYARQHHRAMLAWRWCDAADFFQLVVCLAAVAGEANVSQPSLELTCARCQ